MSIFFMKCCNLLRQTRYVQNRNTLNKDVNNNNKLLKKVTLTEILSFSNKRLNVLGFLNVVATVNFNCYFRLSVIRDFNPF